MKFLIIKACFVGGEGKEILVDIIPNITEGKRVEAAVPMGEDEFRTLAENLPNLIVRYDSALRRTYVNTVYRNLTEPLGVDLLGKTPLDLWLATDPDAEQFTRLLQRVIATGTPETTLIQAGVNGGKTRYWTMNLVPEFGQDGSVCGVLTCAADITVLKECQSENEVSRNQLRNQALRAQSLREEERKRIARELHDDLGQRLTALKLDLSRLVLRFGQDNPALQRQVAEMETEMGSTIQMVREVATRLRPAVLDMGIASALEWLAQEFRKHSNIPCRLWIPQPRMDLDESQATVLFRIVQESLTNIMRHAFASEVFIYLRREPQAVMLEIKDNGVGFDADNTQMVDSYGLTGIEERTLSLGGKLSIDTAPGQGVKLVVHIPVGQTQREEDYDQRTDG